MTDKIIKNDDLVIDWELGVRLAGNRHDLAREMLDWLKKNLPTDMHEIKQAKNDNDLSELLKRVHKLHGALCYCGVPRLKKTIASFEVALKKNHINKIEAFMEDLELEVLQVLDKASQIGD